MPSKAQFILATAAAINAPFVAGAPVNANLEPVPASLGLGGVSGPVKRQDTRGLDDIVPEALGPGLGPVKRQDTQDADDIIPPDTIPALGGAPLKRDIIPQAISSSPSLSGGLNIDARQAGTPAPSIIPFGSDGWSDVFRRAPAVTVSPEVTVTAAASLEQRQPQLGGPQFEEPPFGGGISL